MTKNFLTTPIGDESLDALRNAARLATLRSIRANRALLLSDKSTAELEKCEAVDAKADAAFNAFNAAYKSFIG